MDADREWEGRRLTDDELRAIYAAREQERQEQSKRERREREELEAAFQSLTPRERKVYDLLDELIGAIENAGADVSFFPHGAQMALVEYAKKIAALGEY